MTAYTLSGKRNSPINHIQKTILTEYLTNHPELVRGTFSPTFTFKKAQELWEDISQQLNAVPGGAVKDWRKWRKTWQDLKKVTKSRIVEKKKDMAKTGGGPPLIDTIDDDIANLITPTEIEGHTNVPEPDISFEIMDVENFQNLPETDTTEPKPEQFEEVVDTKDIDEVKQNEETPAEVPLPEEIDHGYTMKYPKGLPKKKITKTQKLQTSINISQQMVKGINSRTGLMEAYYEKKIAFLEHQMLHEKKMEQLEERKINAIEKYTEAMSKLQADIASKIWA